MSADHNANNPYSCPCCKNPWAAATGDFFAKLCDTCAESKGDNAPPAESSSLRSHMDFSVPPSENFYQYAAGAWMRNNPIPPGYPSWNTFQVLRVQSQERLKTVLDDLIAASNSNDTTLTVDQAKVAAFYSAALDEEAIERQGTAPLKVVLDLIEESVQETDGTKRASLLGQFPARFGLFPFFQLSASPDHKNSTQTVAQLSQGGLGLPDRDYYFDADKADKREAYIQHVATMLTLLQDPTAASTETASQVAQTSARQVYDLELRLAEAHMTKTENRDPEATYNKMTVAELSEQCQRQFDFSAYLEAACHSKDIGDTVNVRNVAAIQRVAQVVSSIDESTLRSYLQWRTVGSLAPYLSRAFVQQHFDFYEKCLSGTTEIKPRWKRAMEFTESALGEVLGQLYCEKYFDEECKERAVAIVENVRQALEARLKEVDWMKAEATRQNALKKMAGFRVKIGYPDKWIDYTPLQIESGDSFLEMVFKAEAFDHQRTVDEMNAPTDREKWFMTPQTVGGYCYEIRFLSVV